MDRLRHIERKTSTCMGVREKWLDFAHSFEWRDPWVNVKLNTTGTGEQTVQRFSSSAHKVRVDAWPLLCVVECMTTPITKSGAKAT